MMINMKSIIDVYDWLVEQPGEDSKAHADALEKLIFEDLIYREKHSNVNSINQAGIPP